MLKGAPQAWAPFIFCSHMAIIQNMSPPKVGCVTLPAPPQTMSF